MRGEGRGGGVRHDKSPVKIALVQSPIKPVSPELVQVRSETYSGSVSPV